MTTKRKKTKAISDAGVRFARDIVNKNNSIFQMIDLENDVGNDAYIEFIKDEEATGCCIFVQIKSGESYTKKNGNFVLKSDRDHFVYWASHIMPIAGIVYSPAKNCAVWCDITGYLKSNPAVIQKGPYTIEIPATQNFTGNNFGLFKEHFLNYYDVYKYNIGDALQKFSNRKNQRDCLDGVKYLMTYQRQNIASWYYIITCYRNFRKHSLHLQLTEILSYLPGHGDIFWHKENRIQDTTRNEALALLKEIFGRDEVVAMLEIVTDGGGFARGAIGQCIQAILFYVKDRNAILESILKDAEVEDEPRYWSLLLYLDFMTFKKENVQHCLKLIDSYKHLFKDPEIIDMVSGVREELKENKSFCLMY
jgi:hypothetical protein